MDIEFRVLGNLELLTELFIGEGYGNKKRLEEGYLVLDNSGGVYSEMHLIKEIDTPIGKVYIYDIETSGPGILKDRIRHYVVFSHLSMQEIIDTIDNEISTIKHLYISTKYRSNTDL